MSINYAAIAKTVHAALKDAGAPGVLRRVLADGGTYNPATASVTAPAELQTACTAVVLPTPAKWVDGTLVRVVELTAYLSVIGLDPPKTGDLLVWQGVTYTVISAEVLAPAGLAVLYTAVVKSP